MKRLCVLAVVITMCATSAWGVPIPVFSTTLDDDASITSSGGTLQNSSAHTYVAGAIGNAFESTNSSANAGGWAKWPDAAVTTLFGAWNNTSGVTTDLYFSGTSWGATSGDEGLWCMVKRTSSGDGYLFSSIRNGKLRIAFGNAGDTQHKYTFDGTTAGEIATNAPLTTGVTYHLTVSLGNGVLNVYLDDVGGSTYDNSVPIFTDSTLGAGYYWQLPTAGAVSGSGTTLGRLTREMDIGDRGQGTPQANFGGTLRNGDWVDNVNVYNGVYSPADLVPEPATALLLAGGLALLRRRHRA